MKTVIGQLKAKHTVYCEICGCGNKRNLTAYVYENTSQDIERAKQEINAKAAKKYTCRVCVSIAKSI